jgi:hypothetical protein
MLIIPFRFADEKVRSHLSLDNTCFIYSNENKLLQGVNDFQAQKTTINQPNQIDNKAPIQSLAKPLNNSRQTLIKINNDLKGDKVVEIKNRLDFRLDYIGLISFNSKPIYLNQPINELIELTPNENIAKKTKFSVGLFASLNTSIVNDEETRASFNSNNLIAYKPTISSSKGIIIDYIFNDKLSLSAYYLFQSTSKGKTAFYNSDGFYTIKTKQIDYSKYALLVNYSFNSKNSKLITNNIIGLGPYFGVNKGSVIYQNDVITSFNSNFKKHDYGFKLILGKELMFKEFILGAGLTSDVGLKNVIDSSNQFTSNFNLGLYLNVKYKL